MTQQHLFTPRAMNLYRLTNGKLYRVDGNVLVDVQPRVDLERLDSPAPLLNKPRALLIY
jgi:hypothetical protein